ncbi:acyl-CoA N-acyltransferase [Lasiosphaeria miniovina]|uniref:Acyl-CoA N-acyltransferase n=1 Tax=Lasiosphaeria miniovina TaxID=1954250 RepID=A0AA39ZSQ8_9PEZI|nr:acyl-CoA N-acyltransferase [Lasiosphaeria miniovina]KAK0702970.1 acyl-CoA N-acyltransferase [Lasiosphaeria miniovina]
MPLYIRPAVESDMAAVGRIATDAFKDTLSTVLFPAHLRPADQPDLDEQPAWRAARTWRRMGEGMPTMVAVDTIDGHETVVAFAQWDKPHVAGTAPPTMESKRDGDPITLDKTALAAIYVIMEAETERLIGPTAHYDLWYLLILTVDPRHHRRGIGKMLVRWGLEQAAAEKKGVFLSASPAGKPMYQSLGFRDLGAFEMLGLPHYTMLWEPENEK